MRAVQCAAALARPFPAPSQVDTAGLPLHSSLPGWHNRFFSLSTPLVVPKPSEFFTVTTAKACCILSNQFFALLVFRLCQISRLLSPQTCTRKEYKHIVHGSTGRSSPSTQRYRRMRHLLSVCFSCKAVLPLHSASRLLSPWQTNLKGLTHTVGVFANARSLLIVVDQKASALLTAILVAIVGSSCRNNTFLNDKTKSFTSVD